MFTWLYMRICSHSINSWIHEFVIFHLWFFWAYANILIFVSSVPNTTNSKGVADDKVEPIRKPLLRRLDCLSNNSIHVSHVREPIGPPTEESAGFLPGWRELLRLQRMLIRDGAEVNKSSEAELQQLDNAIVCIDSGAVCAS